MNPLLSRREAGAVALGGVGTALALLPGLSSASDNKSPLFHFHHDHVLGTSLDLTIHTHNQADADRCEKIILDEIERLRRILSTYDPSSEISLLERHRSLTNASPELIEVLRLYEEWQPRSHGVLNAQVGSLIHQWNACAKEGSEPHPRDLAARVEAMQSPGWSLDEKRRTITLLNDQALNINAIGRGYIINKAMMAAREQVPSLRGLLINHGGDLALWGDSGSSDRWSIGVADPSRSEDNAPPLTCLSLDGGAVATSGPYQRNFRVGERRYSHLFDPRTGYPASGIRSATVLAPDNVTANALATTLAVLPPQEGLRLIKTMPEVEALLVLDDGKQLRSAGWRRREIPIAAPLAVESKWPKDYEVALSITLLSPRFGKKIRRPYVGVWVEDEAGKVVKVLALWGRETKYFKELGGLYRTFQGNRSAMQAISKATRAPGKYRLVWDGTDNDNSPVAQGTYTIRVEVNREHGRHVNQTGSLKCEAEGTAITLKETAETEETSVVYGPREK